ncbi:MAG: cell division protein FtsZ [Clostridia bacterium]
MSIKAGARIKVIGVGGCGSNSVNRMKESNDINGVDFVVVNTDKQALFIAKEDTTKIQIGEKLTQGLGAGADPAIGQEAANESREALRNELNDINMLFITAGMGGGTGTGAAPVIARMAKEMDILTIAVVVKPFKFEGSKRMRNAEEGIAKLKESVDTLVVVPNQKLLETLGANVTMVEAMAQADNVLKQAVKGISDIITTPSMINLDFADLRTIMKGKGFAHIGIGYGEGEDKTLNAVKDAVNSPLLETNISGSTGILMYIVGGKEITASEIDNACEKIHDAIDESANIIFGNGIDETMGDRVQVTLIATGFQDANAVGKSGLTNAQLADSFNNMPAYDKNQYPKQNQQQGYNRGQNSYQQNNGDNGYSRPQQQPFNPYPFGRFDDKQPQQAPNQPQAPQAPNQQRRDNEPQFPNDDNYPDGQPLQAPQAPNNNDRDKKIPAFIEKLRRK